MRGIVGAMNFLLGRCNDCQVEVYVKTHSEEPFEKIWCRDCMAKRVLGVKAERVGLVRKTLNWCKRCLGR